MYYVGASPQNLLTDRDSALHVAIAFSIETLEIKEEKVFSYLTEKADHEASGHKAHRENALRVVTPVRNKILEVSRRTSRLLG